jgi:hypothetical protein
MLRTHIEVILVTAFSLKSMRASRSQKRENNLLQSQNANSLRFKICQKEHGYEKSLTCTFAHQIQCCRAITQNCHGFLPLWCVFYFKLSGAKMEVTLKKVLNYLSRKVALNLKISILNSLLLLLLN